MELIFFFKSTLPIFYTFSSSPTLHIFGLIVMILGFHRWWKLGKGGRADAFHHSPAAPATQLLAHTCQHQAVGRELLAAHCDQGIT